MLNKQLGNLGEQLAAECMERRGYKICERQYRTKTGEIDLVCRKYDQVVFCEVKTRTGRQYGSPGQAVTRAKQLKIIRTAQWYLSRYPDNDWQCQFAVIEVYIGENGRPQISVIENAFEL